jgi:hypothetical protein
MENPILFSGEMVRAILAGRKTQTRRALTPQPIDVLPMPKDPCWVALTERGEVQNHGKLIKCRLGVPGDRLWVRETWQAQNTTGQWWHEVERCDRPLHNWAWTNPVEPSYDATPPRWLPSIHMPRAASRIILEIVNVRVERVQEIHRVDARAEGIECAHCRGYSGRSGCTCIENFSVLWESINAKRGYSWESNCWVWVLEFRLL